MARIAIVEDEVVVREYLVHYMRQQDDFETVYSAGSVEDFLELSTEKGDPHVIMLDIDLPGLTGIEGVKLIKRQYPESAVIMLTNYDDSERIFRSIYAGANGYLLKDMPLPDLKRAVKEIMKGGGAFSPTVSKEIISFFQPKNGGGLDEELTSRQKQIAQLLVQGLSYKAIAEHLGIALDTVRQHIKRIYNRLQINSKAELINMVYQDRSLVQ